MKFYTTLHKYYCGIDLHAKILYVCILDQQGIKLVHQKIGADPLALLRLLEPYMGNVTIPRPKINTRRCGRVLLAKYNGQITISVKVIS